MAFDFTNMTDEEKREAYRKLSFSDALKYAMENNKLAWLNAHLNQPMKRPVYPKKVSTRTGKEIVDKNAEPITYADDTTKWADIKAEFVKAFMPALLDTVKVVKKQPTAADMLKWANEGVPYEEIMKRMGKPIDEE